MIRRGHTWSCLLQTQTPASFALGCPHRPASRSSLLASPALLTGACILDLLGVWVHQQCSSNPAPQRSRSCRERSPCRRGPWRSIDSRPRSGHPELSEVLESWPPSAPHRTCGWILTEHFYLCPVELKVKRPGCSALGSIQI